MSLFEVLVLAMYHVLLDKASTKTRRYFLEAIAKVGSPMNVQTETVPKAMCDIVRTFIALLTKRSLHSVITVEGEQYPVSEYSFPERWWELAKARFVYSSAKAIERAEPLFEVESVDGDLLTPSQVRRFFDDFNESQSEGGLIKVAKAPDDFDEVATIVLFRGLVLGDQMAAWNENGSISDVVAQILRIQCPYDGACHELFLYDGMRRRTVEQWLMSDE